MKVDGHDGYGGGLALPNRQHRRYAGYRQLAPASDKRGRTLEAMTKAAIGWMPTSGQLHTCCDKDRGSNALVKMMATAVKTGTLRETDWVTLQV